MPPYWVLIKCSSFFLCVLWCWVVSIKQHYIFSSSNAMRIYASTFFFSFFFFKNDGVRKPFFFFLSFFGEPSVETSYGAIKTMLIHDDTSVGQKKYVTSLLLWENVLTCASEWSPFCTCSPGNVYNEIRTEIGYGNGFGISNLIMWYFGVY